MKNVKGKGCHCSDCDAWDGCWHRPARCPGSL